MKETTSYFVFQFLFCPLFTDVVKETSGCWAIKNIDNFPGNKTNTPNTSVEFKIFLREENQQTVEGM